MRETKSLKRNIFNNTPAINPWIFPIRKSSCEPQQSAQIQPNKAYRLLYQCFNHNFYKFIKRHRSCLGDIEETFKTKVPKQEQALLQQNKEKIFAKYYEKLKREMTYRNNFIQRNITAYEGCYKEAFQISMAFEMQSSKTQLQEKNESIQIKQFSPAKITKRPFSSTVNRNRPIISSQTGFNRTTVGSRQPDIYRSANIQNGQSHSYGKNYTYRNQQFKRTNKNRIFEYQLRQTTRPKSFYLQEQQIYISQRRNQQDYQSQKTNNGLKTFTPNFYPKSSRKQHVKFSCKKLLQQRQKEQIKNKIFMVNSALAVNLARPQGYKPKSQIWQKLY